MPASMILLLKVSRATIAAQSRGLVKVSSGTFSSATSTGSSTNLVAKMI
jgi:hypothetical protein